MVAGEDMQLLTNAALVAIEGAWALTTCTQIITRCLLSIETSYEHLILNVSFTGLQAGRRTLNFMKSMGLRKKSSMLFSTFSRVLELKTAGQALELPEAVAELLLEDLQGKSLAWAPGKAVPLPAGRKPLGLRLPGPGPGQFPSRAGRRGPPLPVGRRSPAPGARRHGHHHRWPGS